MDGRGAFPDQLLPVGRGVVGLMGDPAVLESPSMDRRQRSALLPEMPWCPRGTSGLSPSQRSHPSPEQSTTSMPHQQEV